MGLAPMASPFTLKPFHKLIDLKADGSFRLNLDYFDYWTGLTMTNARLTHSSAARRVNPKSG